MAENPVGVMVGQRLDPQAWTAQTMWWSERERSRPLWWPVGAAWFANDPLDPLPHTHPDASEAFFVAAGTLQLTVGRTPLRMEAGDYCLVPPDTYHEPLNVGDEDLCVFVFVAPNWRDRRWKPEGFTEEDFRGVAEVVPTATSGPLPSDALIESAVLQLPGRANGEPEAYPGSDRALYVLDGLVDITVGHLSGRLGTHQYLHVMGGTRHRVAAAGSTPARVLSIRTGDPEPS